MTMLKKFINSWLCVMDAAYSSTCADTTQSENEYEKNTREFIVRTEHRPVANSIEVFYYI